MKRRDVLAGIGISVSGLAGCSGAAFQSTEPTTTARSTINSSLAEQGRPPNICQQGYVDLGIYALDKPAFAADWSGIEIPERYSENGRLADEDVVIGLTNDGSARAYPMAVLWEHEIVNDTFGTPLIVTFCSLCRSGMVARRVIDETATKFGVTGQLWVPPQLQTRVSEEQGRVFAVERRDPSPGKVRNTGNLVMFDQETASYWSQILARAICGPQTGEQLEILPSKATTWADWRATHPDTDVLLPPPHSTLMDLPG